MRRGRLVVHAHFYQPSRVDPFTGRVPEDASAAPFRDWNARITEECYRPIAERGTAAHISWNMGPTLTGYLATAAPEVLEGFAAADREGGGTGIAQAFHHSILPLAAAHDRRTEILWGARDFEVRFGRRPTAMWLPETAVDLATLAALAEAGVAATILAPWQADVENLDTRRPYRVDVGGGRHVTVVLYDGDLSGAVSFEPAATADADRFARERILPRLDASWAAGPAGGEAHHGDAVEPLVIIASDGELYGHHQSFRDLFLERLVAPEDPAPDRGFDVVDLATAVAEPDGRPHPEIRIRERTSWSCHHGVLRWFAECPDVPDGRWKAPLRSALDRLAGGVDAVTVQLGRDLPGLGDVWAARDAYVDVVIGAVEGEAFAAERLGAVGPPRPTVAGCSRCSRPSAGAWRCSPRTGGTGTIRRGRRRGRSCGPRRVRPGSSTGSRALPWRRGSSPTSRRSARPPSTSTAARSTATRSARSASRPPRADRGMRRSPAWRANAPGP